MHIVEPMLRQYCQGACHLSFRSLMHLLGCNHLCAKIIALLYMYLCASHVYYNYKIIIIIHIIDDKYMIYTWTCTGLL